MIYRIQAPVDGGIRSYELTGRIDLSVINDRLQAGDIIGATDWIISYGSRVYHDEGGPVPLTEHYGTPAPAVPPPTPNMNYVPRATAQEAYQGNAYQTTITTTEGGAEYWLDAGRAQAQLQPIDNVFDDPYPAPVNPEPLGNAFFEQNEATTPAEAALNLFMALDEAADLLPEADIREIFAEWLGEA